MNFFFFFFLEDKVMTRAKDSRWRRESKLVDRYLQIVLFYSLLTYRVYYNKTRQSKHLTLIT